MSSIVVNFPDCGALGTQELGGTVTVTMENCTPPPPEGPPPLVPWWAWTLGAILIAVFVVATAIVRCAAHEERTAQQRIEADKQVAIAKNRKVCITCGSDQLQGSV